MLEAGWSAAMAPNLALYNGSSPHHLTTQTCVLAGDSLLPAVQTEQQQKPVAIRRTSGARGSYMPSNIALNLPDGMEAKSITSTATILSDAVSTASQPKSLFANDAVAAIPLQAGELVEVLSCPEIFATLDTEGKLDGLPFMPEMLSFCGQRFRVLSRADSTCWRGQPRKIESTVHLDRIRCDGSAHDNCHASCLLLWKEAWLRRVNSPLHAVPTKVDDGPTTNGRIGISHFSAAKIDVSSETHRMRSTLTGSDQAMMCQATEVGVASCPLMLANPPRYFFDVTRDYLSGKISFADLRRLYIYFRGKLILFVFTSWARVPWNSKRYKKTPAEILSLQPGEWVQVRSASEILRTLDKKACNKGMEFKAEMFQFCGRKFQVLSRMERRVDEHTGRMRVFRNECIILDSVHCEGQRTFCARNNYHYWREIWLRRC